MVMRTACSKHAVLFNPSTSSAAATLIIAQHPLSLPRRHHNHNLNPFYQSASFSSSRTRSFPPPPSSSSSSDKKLSPTSSPLSDPALSTSAYSSSASSSPTTLSPIVNPPATTRPADLELPSKEENGAGAKYFFLLGKAYFKFYKTGLKNVYGNYKASIPLRRKLGISAYLPASPWTDKPAAGTGSMLTRSEFQLLRRSAYDVRRMIPFALIFMICGEFTPFVVLAIGNKVTPLTCRVPKQFVKTRMQRMQQKEAALSSCPDSMALMGNDPQMVQTFSGMLAGGEAADAMSVEEVMRSCVVFGVAKSMAPPGLAGPGFVRRWVVDRVYRPRLRRWLDYLEADDRLIVKGGGVRGMSDEEVRMAVDERGGVDCWTAEVGELGGERVWLNSWLEGRS